MADALLPRGWQAGVWLQTLRLARACMQHCAGDFGRTWPVAAAAARLGGVGSEACGVRLNGNAILQNEHAYAVAWHCLHEGFRPRQRIMQLCHDGGRARRRISLIRPSSVKPSVLPTAAQMTAPRGNISRSINTRSIMSRGLRRPWPCWWRDRRGEEQSRKYQRAAPAPLRRVAEHGSAAIDGDLGAIWALAVLPQAVGGRTARKKSAD